MIDDGEVGIELLEDLDSLQRVGSLVDVVSGCDKTGGNEHPERVVILNQKNSETHGASWFGLSCHC